MGRLCMCSEVGKVKRDGKSTCARCGGEDAYGGPERSQGPARATDEIGSILQISTRALRATRKHLEIAKAENKLLRQMLCFRHGCSITSLYLDDDEHQCGRCGVDFLRDDANDIFQALTQGEGHAERGTEDPQNGECRDD